MITKATSPGYLYSVTTDSTCIITDQDTRYNLCKALANHQGMFVAIGGVVECSDDNVVLTQASAVSGGTRFEVVTTRPDVGEVGVIYLVPAANSTTENLYEEWLWVDDKWEQIGSAGINVSNFAQLTTANTFSNTNTFNGNLIKKTSGSLADNSVLNRSEMDNRYGRLVESNDWKGNNEFAGIKTTGMISLNFNNTAYIKGSSNSMTLKAANINLHGNVTVSNNKSVRVDAIETDNISGINSLKLQADNSSINIADNEVNIDSKGAIILNTDAMLRLTGMAALSLGCRGVSMWLDAANEGSISLRAYTAATMSMSHKNKNITLDATTIDLDASSVNMADNGMLKFSGRSHITENVISGIPVLDNDSRKISLNKQSSTVPSTDKYCVDITPGLHSPYIYSPHINAAYMTVNTISGVKELNAGDLRINANVSIVGYLGLKGTLTAGSERDTIDVRANLHMQGKSIKDISNISSPNGVSLGIKSNIHAYGNSINEVDAVKVARLGASSLSSTPGKIDVEGSLHFPSAAGSYVDPDIVIANAELRAVNLHAILGPDKYGIRVTNTSCQLFGIDFNYGDVWSETNDKIKAQDATPMPGLDSASYFDTVKIRKPAVSIETTGIGSLSFDYATAAYIRTFPNDGGQGIFEFQAGNWTDSDADWIKRGPVDLRKASATTLGPTSVLNMEEGDARWGGGSGNVLIDLKLANPSVSTKTELNSIEDIGNDPAYGIAIGPGITANVYRDIAIGGWLSTKAGQGDNTLLGYGFYLQNSASKNILIGRGNSTHVYSSRTVLIGNASDSSLNASNAVAINGYLYGNDTIAIGGTATESAVVIGSGGNAAARAVAIGAGTTAGVDGTALGAYSVAGENELVLQAGAVPAVAMQLYSGESWENRNNTGYLRFVTARTATDISKPAAADREEITISKSNLWSALDRAKYRGAQPYAYYTASSISNIPALEPNSITHIGTYNSGAAIDLSGITLAQYAAAITTAELWLEITSAGTTITWPEGMLWPDEADPTIAPSFTGPAESTEAGYIMQRLYCVTLRTQHSRNISGGTSASVLIAAIAYTIDSKLSQPEAGGGGN